MDVAECYGWIDGQAKSLDDRHFLERHTPRRATSVWSNANRECVGRVIAADRMQPAGLAEIERAKADGRWDAAYLRFADRRPRSGTSRPYMPFHASGDAPLHIRRYHRYSHRRWRQHRWCMGVDRLVRSCDANASEARRAGRPKRIAGRWQSRASA